jgi:hypothetical protein
MHPSADDVKRELPFAAVFQKWSTQKNGKNNAYLGTRPDLGELTTQAKEPIWPWLESGQAA